MTKQTKSEQPDPRDARIADLESALAERDSQLAHQRHELMILAPRHGGDHARDQRRRVEYAKDQEALAIRRATPEERVKMFPDAFAVGAGVRFLQTLASFCDGGVVAFARICPSDVLEMVMASTPHPDLLRADMAQADELPRFVRYTSAVIDAYLKAEAAGEAIAKPTVPNILTCAEAPIAITEEQAESLRSVGIAVRRIGRDDAPHYSGLRMHTRDSLDESREAFEVRCKVDPEFVALIKARVLVVRDLTEAEVRARLSIARDISVS